MKNFVQTRLAPFLHFWPYALLFGLAFVLFSATFYAEKRFIHYLAHIQTLAKKNNIIIDGLHVTGFLPQISVEALAIPAGQKWLQCSSLFISTSLLPPGCDFGLELLDGRIYGSARFKGWIDFDVLLIDFHISQIALAKIFEMAGKENFIEKINGAMEGRGVLNMPLAKWRKLRGSIDLKIQDASITQSLPVLKIRELSPIYGNIATHLSDGVLNIQNCELLWQDNIFAMSGEIRPWYSKNPDLELKTRLKINPELFVEDLMPARTMSQIRQNSLIQTRITGALSSPNLRLEN